MSESNIFILLNLGCEMLYVIDQRLKAQAVSLEKSIQVMRDITCVLLDPKFLQRLMIGNQNQKTLITPEHCKIMLNDIACCSLMRLDEISMSKLWDLMTMIYKWQLFVSKYPQHILDITFRHLDEIGRIYPDVKKAMLVDYTKNNILDFWNSYDEIEQVKIYDTIKNWFECFNIKISILIRLGFQGLDGSLFKNVDMEYFENFLETTGDNIYNKSVDIIEANRKINNNVIANQISKFDNFIDQLNVTSVMPEQQDIIKRTNILFDDFDLNIVSENEDGKSEICENTKSPFENSDEFIQITTARKRTSASWETIMCSRQQQENSQTCPGKDLKSLLSSNLT